MSKPETIKIDDVEYIRKDSIPPPYTPGQHGPWELGKAYFIRTVTMHLHGILVDVTEHELVLINAAWIADSGRFHDFITGKAQPNEVEPFVKHQPVIVGRGALIDAVQLPAVFETQK